MRHTMTGLIAAGVLTLLLNACGGGGGAEPPNVVPLANAGAPQSVNAGATVVLNGTASADSDGTIAAYAWAQTAGTAVVLNGATSSQPTFVAPTVTSASTLTFSLVVTDNLGATSAASSVTITVTPNGRFPVWSGSRACRIPQARHSGSATATPSCSPPAA